MTLPNFLTLFRIVVVIPFVATFYYSSYEVRWLAVVLYWIACLTDYLDGVIARHQNQISSLGKFLDPVADKILISAALFMLAGQGVLKGLSLIPALVILGRELFVSDFREHLKQSNVPLKVSFFSKLKTLTQMVSLSLLVMYDPIPLSATLYNLGIVLLWLSAIFSCVTGYQYFKENFKNL